MADEQGSCSAVLGVQVPTNTESVGITSLVNEACDSVTVRGAHYERDPNQKWDGTVQNLVDYLARPWIVNNFPFSQTSRVPIFAQDVNDDFLSVNVPFYRDRLGGCAGFRATLVFRLQVASNPFLAGRLRLTWFPHYSDAAVYDPTTYANGVSMLPGVELDLAEQTSCEFRVPWVHASSYWPWFSFYGGLYNRSWGRLSIFSYLPLSVASGTTPPQCTLYFSMEDIELVAAAPPLYITALPQGGSLPPVDAEAKGPMSQSLYNLSKAVSFLSKGVPSISSLAGPTAWALSRASGLASAFGWSKPLNMNPCQRMLQTGRTFENNCDGIDTTWNLGLSMNNHVAPTTLAGSDVDEMAFDYILQQYALIANGSLTTADVQFTLKYACQISPAAMWYAPSNNYIIPTTTVLVADIKSFFTTPAFYVANCFRQWRGGFKFRIKIAKTKFHTGRLLLQFAPADFDPSTSESFIAGPVTGPYNVWSKIWDLREGNTIEFEVPYVNQFQYTLFNQSIGTFSLGIIEPLNGPATVSTSCPFAVEVKCLPGFEFAVPQTQLFHNSAQVPLGFVAQGGAFPPKTTSSQEDDQLCIGERITSVKQMISRSGNLVTGSTGNFLAGPWYDYAFTSYDGGVPPSSVLYPTTPYCYYFSWMYVFARGSTVFDIYDVNSGGPANTGATMQRYFDPLDPSALDNAGPVIDRTYALHTTLPFYARTTKVLIHGGLAEWNPPNRVNLLSDIVSPGIASYFIRAGDDAQLGYFIGTPPLDLRTSYTDTSPNPSSSALFTYLTGI
jgi:hypothetical protein